MSTRDEMLRERLEECELIVGEIEESRVYNIIKQDAERYIELLDSRWQDITDDKQFQESRVLKLAYSHLVNLKEKYQQELEAIKKELLMSDNKDTMQASYYDDDTIIDRSIEGQGTYGVE